MNIKVNATIKKENGSTSQDVLSPGPIEVQEGSTGNMVDLARASYPPVGHCIYCGGKEDLRREHIVPFGLNGTAVLPAASCPCCAKITGSF